MTNPAASLHVVRLPGLTPYGAAWALQQALHAEIAAEVRADTLLLLEHPPTLTMGRRGGWQNLVTEPAALERHGFELWQIDRGGDITYHGPGQLVGYPIINMRRAKLMLGDYVRALENAHIGFLETLGVVAERNPGFTGVWCGAEKITAIGVRITQNTTLHGFAINVSTALRDFDHIVPCGLVGRGVTSLTTLLGDAAPSIDGVASGLADALAEQLGRGLHSITRAELPPVSPHAIQTIARASRMRFDASPTEQVL